MFSLEQNYPNPFNTSTTIPFAVPRPSYVNITIYDVKGRALETICQGKLEAGKYEANWLGRHFDSGIYIVKFTG